MVYHPRQIQDQYILILCLIYAFYGSVIKRETRFINLYMYIIGIKLNYLNYYVSMVALQLPVVYPFPEAVTKEDHEKEIQRKHRKKRCYQSAPQKYEAEHKTYRKNNGEH